MNQVSKVIVRIHEKRNHPHAYGHYDAEVGFEVDTPQAMTEAELDGLVRFWQAKAKRAAVEECDRWEEEMRHAHTLEKARQKIAGIIYDVRIYGAATYLVEAFEDHLPLFEEEEREEFIVQWNKALMEYEQNRKKDVQRDDVPY